MKSRDIKNEPTKHIKDEETTIKVKQILNKKTKTNP